MLWIGFIAAAIVVVAINVALFSRRPPFRAERAAPTAREVSGGRKIQFRVGAVLTAFAAVIFVLSLVYTDKARETPGHRLRRPCREPRARRWKSRRPASSGYGATTTPTAPSPTTSWSSRPTPRSSCELLSTDVVHTWNVPDLAGKRDAVPGKTNKVVIEVAQSLEGKANHVLNQDMTRQMLTPGMGSWGLGVQIGGSESMRYFSHGGANEGYRDMLAAYEKGGDGAVVMTSGDNGDQLADEVMHSIAAEYGWPDWKPDIRAVVTVDEKTLQQYTGTYQLNPGFDLVVTLEGGQLITQATGQPKFTIYAKSENRFFPLEFPAEIEFVKEADGKVNALILHQGGHDMRAPRK